MSRFVVLAPAAVLVGFFLAMFAVYSVRVASGRALALGTIKANPILNDFWAGYLVWLVRPIERILVARNVSPNALTALSLAACIAAGVAVAFDHVATAAWLYIAGGILDVMDGRLARALRRETRAGALFDSVADRWAELALFTGLAWTLRDDDAWLLAVMAAIAGSLMTSYTRARGESLGVVLRSGAMQRAERILIVSVGMLVAAALGASPSTEAYVPDALGTALAICGGLSIGTAIRRWIDGQRALDLAQPPTPPPAAWPAPAPDPLAAAAAIPHPLVLPETSPPDSPWPPRALR